MSEKLLRRMLLIVCYRVFDLLKDSATTNINSLNNVVKDISEIIDPAKCKITCGYSESYKAIGYEVTVYYNKEYSLMFYYNDCDENEGTINETTIEEFASDYVYGEYCK